MFHGLASKLGIALLVLVTAFLGASAALATWTVLDGRPAVEARLIVTTPPRLPTDCRAATVLPGGVSVL